MKNYVVSMYDKGQNEAGPKAKVDAENFLAEEGFEKINFYFSGARKAKLVSIKQRLWDFPRKLSSLNAELVVFQYPSFDPKTDHAILKQLKKDPQTKIIYLIHDIEALRAYRDDLEKVKEEIAFLQQSDGLIVHNRQMKQWLKENGVTRPMVELEIFDYDNPVVLKTDKEFDRSICYAGNLQKAEFLQKYTSKYPLALFGPNKMPSYPENITYQGSFSPEELPKKLIQNFGLVWDGTSIDYCDGVFGEYLKYNDPHKTSLYLSSGLPVIIWKQAALADFVAKNNVGLCVESLSEVDELLSKMTKKDYEEMCQNVLKVAQKMRSGAYLKTALAKLSDEVKK